MLLDPIVHELLSIWEEGGCRARPEELCAAHPELIDELREHMGRLQSTDRIIAGQSGDAEQPAPEIDGYKILSPLGRGGMGIVWRAVQLNTGRDVALKVMSAGAFASERARQRFIREVELTARLEHPNIARLYDSGVCRGLHYFAMQLIDGVPLDQFVSRGTVSRAGILSLIETICGVMQHAHQRGVIHRDLKPSNIL